MTYLNSPLAQSIVERTMDIIDSNVNIMNVKGEIIGSGNRDRLGEIHEGALLVLAQKRTVEIDAAVANQLHGVRPGINLPLRANGEVIGVIGLTGLPDSVRQYGELVRMTAEMMVEQAGLLHLLAQESRFREELVLDMIRSEQPSPALAGWAQRLDVDLQQARVVAVIEVDSGQLGVDAAREELRNLQTLLAYPERDNLVATVSLTEMVVLKPALNRYGVWDIEDHRVRVGDLLSRMNERSRLAVRIALGNYFPGPGGVARSYRTAATTLKVGRFQAPGQQAFFYQDLLLPVLLESLRSGWQAEELMRPMLRLKKHDGNGILRRSLSEWFANQTQASATAKALCVHRNTLEYRLNRIADITGLDLAQFDNRLLLFIALQLDTLA
jgi:carbohydrate diacid regulator